MQGPVPKCLAFDAGISSKVRRSKYVCRLVLTSNFMLSDVIIHLREMNLLPLWQELNIKRGEFDFQNNKADSLT